MTDPLWYPSVTTFSTSTRTSSPSIRTPVPVQRRGDIEFALAYVSEGSFGEIHETIHEKAFHLLRLLVANHPFVDGNKRTALNTTVVFYLLNGYRFEYDNEIREILKQFGTDETMVDEDDVLGYLRTNTTDIDLNEVISEWRGDLVEYGLDQLSET